MLYEVITLDDLLSSEQAGTRIADIDYDTYAEGEAALGWLNAEIVFDANRRNNFV